MFYIIEKQKEYNVIGKKIRENLEFFFRENMRSSLLFFTTSNLG